MDSSRLIIVFFAPVLVLGLIGIAFWLKDHWLRYRVAARRGREILQALEQPMQQHSPTPASQAFLRAAPPNSARPRRPQPDDDMPPAA